MIAPILAVVVGSLLLLSCVVTSHDFSAEVTCEQFGSMSGHTAEFVVEVGDKIRLELCSNPTTGFEWEYDMSGDAALQEEDRDFIEAEAEDVVGAAGKQLWTFEAVAKGTAEVSMEYSQPWDGGTKAEWTYTMTVTVR